MQYMQEKIADIVKQNINSVLGEMQDNNTSKRQK